ncbi:MULTISPECIES: ribosome silencing factor [Peptoniphilus]|jgi:iojap-like protein|uniref:ribosome silencing factor n=1 Tax=Peptoniphilus TaxID=162289 RepID=UPI000287D8E3|nr:MULTISPECIES: ribosome silencing factor [Peptoniphilus]MBS6610952.1 ribosome silencing factor [Peptoniphilus harei]MDU1043959.1 ribosome silencing factor [Peptoniphilus rhinitidis]MDU1954813.1 ribosome silencing factor [Peptoniphilus lacydonensis]MDU2109225.1 ribosome silencing factor [Peptoniphilus lacydonensis]MDU2115742.1 ribosome silencing factor [Peptoniphilus lacydonensis]
MTVQEKLDIIVKSCESKKGIDIKVLDIKGMTSIADYFVIVSGSSSTQVDALAREIDEKLSEKGINPLNSEGKNSSRWIILDFGDIIVHVFHKDEREYYNLERLWESSENNENIEEE